MRIRPPARSSSRNTRAARASSLALSGSRGWTTAAGAGVSSSMGSTSLTRWDGFGVVDRGGAAPAAGRGQVEGPRMSEVLIDARELIAHLFDRELLHHSLT